MASTGVFRASCFVVWCLALAGCEESDVRLGREALKAGNEDKALNLFQVAAQRSPSDGNIQALLALIYAHKGELRASADSLSTAKRLSSSDHDMEPAIEAIQALALQNITANLEGSMRVLGEWPTPDVLPILLRSADDLAKQGNTADALKILNDAIRLYPKSAAAYFTRGSVQITEIQKNQDKTTFDAHLKDVIADCTKAIDLEATNSKAYLIRAVAWSLKNDAARMALDLDLAIENDPKNADALMRRAGMKLQEKQFDQAMPS